MTRLCNCRCSTCASSCQIAVPDMQVIGRMLLLLPQQQFLGEMTAVRSACTAVQTPQPVILKPCFHTAGGAAAPRAAVPAQLRAPPAGGRPGALRCSERSRLPPVQGEAAPGTDTLACSASLQTLAPSCLDLHQTVDCAAQMHICRLLVHVRVWQDTSVCVCFVSGQTAADRHVRQWSCRRCRSTSA